MKGRRQKGVKRCLQRGFAQHWCVGRNDHFDLVSLYSSRCPDLIESVELIECDFADQSYHCSPQSLFLLQSSQWAPPRSVHSGSTAHSKTTEPSLNLWDALVATLRALLHPVLGKLTLLISPEWLSMNLTPLSQTAFSGVLSNFLLQWLDIYFLNFLFYIYYLTFYSIRRWL